MIIGYAHVDDGLPFEDVDAATLHLC